MQEITKINDVNVPIIKEGGEIYYPISYMGDKVLLKDLSPSQLKQNGYGNYIKQFDIDYGEGIGGVQFTYCISEEGLKRILFNCRIGRLNVEQKIFMKNTCLYLKLNINIDTEEKFLDFYSEDIWKQYDFWFVECIEAILKENPNIKWQRCSKCGKYYPYDISFFSIESNPKNKNNLKTRCNNCYKNLRMLYYNNKLLTNIYYNDGKTWYLYFKSNNTNINIESVYNHYINNNLSYPTYLKNSIHVGNIIVKYYKDNILNNLDLVNEEYISKISKIPEKYISMKMIDKMIINCTKKKEIITKFKILKAERLANIKLKSVAKEIKLITYEEAHDILNNYIINNNIIINDIYNYDYYKLLQKTKVKHYLYNNKVDTLEFIVNYYNWEYAPYKFKTIGYKFWKKKYNVDKTLKYLIEKDLKIPIEKIPLYITKYALTKYSSSLYNIVNNKKFDNSLFNWINRLYPDIFIEADFDLAVYRNKFDSIEEGQINDILKNKFKNVLYNQRRIVNINIDGMMPDWFIFTDTNLYIVEYFGMYIAQQDYNKIVHNYITKANEKMEKYKKFPYGIKILIFPEDLKNNYESLNLKLNDIV